MVYDELDAEVRCPQGSCSKETITSENPIPRPEIFKSVHHVKYEGRGQVTTFVVCAVFSLSFQAVVLLTKTAINHCFF